MRIYLLILAGFLGLSFTIFSFGKSRFTGDPELYTSELKEYLKNVGSENGKIVNQFVKAWEGDSVFTDRDKEDIIKLSQNLEKKNARPYPHFVKLLKCMLIFHEKNVSEELYSDWLEGFDVYLHVKKPNLGEISKVLDFSILFFSEDLLYRSASTQWKAKSTSFKIKKKKGLLIEFDNTELICTTNRNDSINLFEAKGHVDPAAGVWNGTAGLVTWERGGFTREEVNASLKDYQIKLNKSEYEAKEVAFTNKNLFEEPVIGDLHDKVRHIPSPSGAVFPKFYSHKETFEIKDLYEDVDYKGGLSMQGSKIVGRGTRQNPSKIFLYRNDTLVLVATSLYFGFKADQVASEKTSITIKLRQDSIYHPDLFFTFRIENRELTLLKTKSFSSMGPYSNSYHKVDMNFEQLIWRLDENFMRFTAPRGATIGNASFESENFYNQNKFDKLQMMDDRHPLISIRNFAKRFGNTEFPIRAYANDLNMSIAQVKHMIMRMAFGGFIFYDDNTEWVYIKPRLEDFLKASVNKIDYDVMAFSSNVESPLENAVFDLRTYDLIINGIPRISVSDSQNVAIIPSNTRIILKKNRDFQFDGTVIAGLLTFHGKGFYFKYDSFKVDLDKVDSVNISYMTGKYNNLGKPEVESVKNLLEQVTGEVLIDKADNKSGRTSYPEYPIFRSEEKSYVYYDSKSTGGGKYAADSFYFEVEAFEMDSLDNFSIHSLKYQGEFKSGGILPDMKKELTIQEDNSLGFKHKTEGGGMPIFGGKGTFDNEIWLSNKGLRGAGKLNYLSSTIESEDFMFYPDSMVAFAQKFDIEAPPSDTLFPEVHSENNLIRWDPFNDVLHATKTDKDFTIINDSTILAGEIQLEPSGITGSGKMDLKSSDLVSKRFTFKTNEVFADTADFLLKSLKGDGYTVLTENIKSHINYQDGKGWFKANEDYSLVTFPENKYISYIDDFTWDMDKTTLSMGTKAESDYLDSLDENIESEGIRFISTDPTQDSITFVAPFAYYDYSQNVLNATGVNYIEIADARIYPKGGVLTVQQNYKIKTLVDARIKANKETKYHNLYAATVNIEGRNYYSGMANYDYIDENFDSQLIHFKKIDVDDDGQTFGEGELFNSTDFTLSPVFKYQGRVKLFSNDSLLTFDGAVKMEHNCDKLPAKWLEFESKIDPKNIYIPLGEVLKDISKKKLYTGPYISFDSVHVYPTFFTYRRNYSDNALISPGGYLYYDKASRLYKVGSKEKINDFALSEDYVSFHREDCRLYGEGNIKLGQDLGTVFIKNYGTVNHYVDERKTELDLIMAIDFFMTQNMINLVGRDIDSFPRLSAADLTRPIYKKAMNAWVGEETAVELSEELNLFGTIKNLPDELKHSILLNEIKLTWNDQTNSYQSKGKIGIASINGIQINKKVDGFFELRIKRSGDVMDLYLQLDRRNYYYFGYTRGVMQTLSSNREYVETILDMKDKHRKLKTSRGQTPYHFLISTDKKKDNFYRRWQDQINPPNNDF